VKLRQFDQTHIGEDCTNLTGMHENGLFYECTFCTLNGLTLKDCDLNQSTFLTDRISDALGFTLTLGCHSFSGVEYSPLLFDLLLTLMTMSKGNDDKREKLIEIVGRPRYEALMRALKSTE
jgi:hypothetical protein